MLKNIENFPFTHKSLLEDVCEGDWEIRHDDDKVSGLVVEGVGYDVDILMPVRFVGHETIHYLCLSMRVVRCWGMRFRDF